MVAVVFMFLLGSGVVLGAYYALTTLPARMEQRRLDQRLGEISHTKEDEEKSIDLLKTRDEGPLPAIERMLGGTTRGTQLGRWIEQSGVKISISSLALYALSGAAV